MKSVNHLYHKSIRYGFFSLFFLLLTLLLLMGQSQKNQEALASQLSPAMLRFHILANSDKKADQDIKLEVRSLILDYISSRLDSHAGKEETQDYLRQNQAEIETAANRYLSDHGFTYEAELELTTCYFPTRVYDDLVIPAGYYDAARIILGQGKGHNWWCVLYPRLCFVDAVCEEVPDDSRDKITSLLKQGDASLLEDHRPDINIRFYLLPFLNPKT